MTPDPSLMAKARSALSTVFGFSDFRPGQEDVLSAVLAGEDVLAVMPTGSGKSLCFQLPAIVRGGLTLVVSPLIALMRDQVAQLRELGVEAASLNSASDADERRRVSRGLDDRSLKLLYIAPERLLRDDVVATLSKASIDLLAIDEAHCVSQWGHDFRPEYLRLREVAEALHGVQTIGVTATADAPDPSRNRRTGCLSAGPRFSSARSTVRTSFWRCGRNPTRPARSSTSSPPTPEKQASSTAPPGAGRRSSPPNSPAQAGARCPITPDLIIPCAPRTRTPFCAKTIA